MKTSNADLVKEWVFFASFKKSLTSVSLKIKFQLYNTIVLPPALYASETWKSTAAISKRLNVFNQRCLRKILKILYLDQITNEEVLRRAQSRPLK